MDVVRKLKWTTTAIKQRNFVLKYWNFRYKSDLYSKNGCVMEHCGFN